MGLSGTSGYSGQAGVIGVDGDSGVSGFSGQDGIIGVDGLSGVSGISGFSGFSGTGGSGIQEKPIEVTTSTTGIATPDIVKVGKVDCLSFDASIAEAVDFVAEMPDDADTDSDMKVVFGYHMSSADSGAVRLTLDYEVVSMGGDTTPGAATGTLASTVNPSNSAEIREEATFTIPGSVFTATTDSLRFTIKRDVDHVDDTHTGEWRIETISLRYNGFGAPTTNSGISGFSGFAGTGVQEQAIEVTSVPVAYPAPTTVKVGKVSTHSFDASTDEAIDFIFEPPQDLDTASDLTLVIGYHMSSANSGTVRLALDYDVVALGGDTTPGAATGSLAVTVDPSNSAEIREEATFTIPNGDISATTNSIRFQLRRDTAHAGDTHTGEFRIESLCVRYIGFGASSGTSGYSGLGLQGLSGASGYSGQAGGSGETLSEDIYQASHGFSLGNGVRHNGTSWVKAQADTAANAEVHAVVGTILDADNFTAVFHGKIILSGLTAGSEYFLSAATPGLLTTTPPSTSGQIRKPVMVATSTTEGLVNIQLGFEVSNTLQSAFHAYNASDQTGIPTSPTRTKVTFSTEVFDGLGNYDNSTNYRHTPSVSGLYLYSAQVSPRSISNNATGYIYLYKNGSPIAMSQIRASFTTQHATTGLSFLVAMNGTTDYAEIYYEHNEGFNSQLNGGANSANWFAGVRVSPYAEVSNASLYRDALMIRSMII